MRRLFAQWSLAAGAVLAIQSLAACGGETRSTDDRQDGLGGDGGSGAFMSSASGSTSVKDPSRPAGTGGAPHPSGGTGQGGAATPGGTAGSHGGYPAGGATLGGSPGAGGFAGSAGYAGGAGTGPDAGDDSGGGNAGTGAIDAGPPCVTGKLCNGVCVTADNVAYGCGGNTCAPCAFAHANATCVTGECRLAQCVAGFADCDGDPTNGCESNITSDPNNCGNCGMVCDLAGGTPICINGLCPLPLCSPGLADCNSNPADGCETNVSADEYNCGGCGVVCGSLEICYTGECLAVATD